ncbi:MAG: outer membrane lipoprotein carrier protein LolA [Nitrospira sp.]|nr:outer membrane lipoprotein carrier protein LolA [Nitrospira sp.]
MKNTISHSKNYLCVLCGFQNVFFGFVLFFAFQLNSHSIGADIISKIIEMQKSIRTMRADFIQEKYSQLLEKPIISSGIFFFSVPERFVWDYKDDMKVISDGKRLMLYYKKQQEADIMDISKFPSLPVSFSIENLSKRYRTEVLEAKSYRYVLKVKPVIEMMPIREILITLDEKATPIEVKMTERTGDITIIRFSNMKVNIMIPDETFSMKVPEGVHVRNNLK